MSQHPLNSTEPSGALDGNAFLKCSTNPGAAPCAELANTTSALGANWLCLRSPFGGNNGNGGCETTFSTSQGTQLIGATVATVAGNVATVGIGDLVLPSIVAAHSAGGWEAFDAIHTAITLPFVFAPTIGIAGGVVWWGYSAIARGPEGC